MARSHREADTTETREPPLRRRIGWFVLLYLAGLLAAGAVVYLLRAVLGVVFTPGGH